MAETGFDSTRYKWRKVEGEPGLGYKVHHDYTILGYDLEAGTLDMLVLKVLSRGTQHGYGIVRAIQAGTDAVLNVEEGALYPALHRMEKRGWLSGVWGRSEHGRRARFYDLTAVGKKRLTEEVATWERSSQAISRLLQNASVELPG